MVHFHSLCYDITQEREREEGEGGDTERDRGTAVLEAAGVLRC